MELLETDLRDLGHVRAPEGFAERVLAAVGIAPRVYDSYAEVATSLGVVHVAWNTAGISAVRRTGGAREFERWFASRLGRPVRREAVPPERLARQVVGAIAGHDRRLRFDMSALRVFEQDVLRKTAEIPRGEVRSYAWVAREIGRPRAVRAVGTALANNPIPFLIPCHRVVRSDGALGQYSAGGPEVKRAILRQEGLDPGWLGIAVCRQPDDPRVLPAHLRSRAPHQGVEPGVSAQRARGAGGWLPALHALPAHSRLGASAPGVSRGCRSLVVLGRGRRSPARNR